MRQAIKKEIIEGIRTYRFLIIMAIFLFFALMNPILNKLVLPEVLKSQFNGISEDMLSQMIVTSQRDCVRGYLTDVFEIATIVVVLTLSAIIAGELKSKTFIFPICSRKDFATLVLAKLIVYGSFLMMATTISVTIDYAYSGVLFGQDLPGILPVVRSGLLQGLYYMFVLGLIMLAGSFAKKPMTAGLLALVPAYGTHILSSLLNVGNYTPAGLLSEAGLIAVKVSSEVMQPIIITIGLVVVMVVLTVLRLQALELARR